MLHRCLVAAIAIAALQLAANDARAYDDALYPNLKGQWHRTTAPRYDPNDRNYDRAPLTPEYRAIYLQNLKDQAAGGQGTDPTYTCLAPGMPRSMNAYEPLEWVVTPRATYMLTDHIHDSRRIHTDGRPWPAAIEPTFNGLSIGQWIDEDGDGKYDVLVVETRHLAGPRSIDASGLLLHKDNQTIIKERIYLDKADPNVLYDEITTIDNALTRPWTVTKKYTRDKSTQPVWREVLCAENNNHVEIGGENYFLSADGLLMPARKGQSPPDLKYFNTEKK